MRRSHVCPVPGVPCSAFKGFRFPDHHLDSDRLIGTIARALTRAAPREALSPIVDDADDDQARRFSPPLREQVATGTPSELQNCLPRRCCAFPATGATAHDPPEWGRSTSRRQIARTLFNVPAHR